jgi:peptidyl-prolyl cis-trans isomerase C
MLARERPGSTPMAFSPNHGSSAHVLTSLVLAMALSSAACGEDAPEERPTPEPTTTHGLTAEQATQVAAVVGETEITVGEVAEALNEQSPYLRARYTSPERRREFLDHLVQFELLVQEAERRGYRDRAEVQDARKQALVSELMREEIDAQLSPEDVTDDEVRAYFEAHPEEFDQPEQIRASHVLSSDRSRAMRILAEVKATPGDIAGFRRIAIERSEDPETRSRGGDLRFFSRPPEGEDVGDWRGPPPAVARAAFGLTENGKVFDDVVESPQGFHVIARTAHRPAMRRTLDEVARVIRHRLYRDRRDAAIAALLDRLRTEARVESHPEALSQVRVPDVSTRPGEHDEHHDSTEAAR